MGTTKMGESTLRGSDASMERVSDVETVVTRTVNGPVRVVWDAWTKPELFRRWWVPKSFPITLESCEMDVRVGGGYRLVFGFQGEHSAFFGRYLEVTPRERLSWTNEEDGGETITTVTFEEADGRTFVRIHDRYPTREALDEAIASGSTSGMCETVDQLDDVVRDLTAAG